MDNLAHPGNALQELTKQARQDSQIGGPSTDVGKVLRSREQNVIYDTDSSGAQIKIQGELKGKEQSLQEKVLNDVRDIQSTAAKCGKTEYGRQVEQAAVKTREPWRLLVPP